MKEKTDWEPDVRKSMEMYKRTGGKFQQQVNDIAKEMRENAVSPLDLLAEQQSFFNSVQNKGK